MYVYIYIYIYIHFPSRPPADPLDTDAARTAVDYAGRGLEGQQHTTLAQRLFFGAPWSAARALLRGRACRSCAMGEEISPSTTPRSPAASCMPLADPCLRGGLGFGLRRASPRRRRSAPGTSSPGRSCARSGRGARRPTWGAGARRPSTGGMRREDLAPEASVGLRLRPHPTLGAWSRAAPRHACIEVRRSDIYCGLSAWGGSTHHIGCFPPVICNKEALVMAAFQVAAKSGVRQLCSHPSQADRSGDDPLCSLQASVSPHTVSSNAFRWDSPRAPLLPSTRKSSILLDATYRGSRGMSFTWGPCTSG